MKRELTLLRLNQSTMHWSWNTCIHVNLRQSCSLWKNSMQIAQLYISKTLLLSFLSVALLNGLVGWFISWERSPLMVAFIIESLFCMRSFFCVTHVFNSQNALFDILSQNLSVWASWSKSLKIAFKLGRISQYIACSGWLSRHGLE